MLNIPHEPRVNAGTKCLIGKRGGKEAIMSTGSDQRGSGVNAVLKRTGWSEKEEIIWQRI